MKFLTNLLVVEQKEDSTGLPDSIISEIRKNIVKGAKDTEQKWANALELVHKSYEVAGVERPHPDMKSAWRQYEENIQYAVEQLAKFRGLDADWRMSSRIFHEAMQKKNTFRVAVIGGDYGDGYTVSAKSLDDVIDSIKAKNRDLFDIEIKQDSPQKARLLFSKWGIRKNYRLEIEQIIDP